MRKSNWIIAAWAVAFMVPTVFVHSTPCCVGVCLAQDKPSTSAPAVRVEPNAAKPDAAGPKADAKPDTKSTPASKPTSSPTSEPAMLTELPVGDLTTAKMDLIMPPGLRELTLKFQKILVQRQSWWREYSKSYAGTGQPAPYHPNMGITPEEYEQLLKLSNQVRLERSEDAQLRIAKNEAGAFVLSSLDGRLLDVTGISIDFKKRILHTPIGDVDACMIVQRGEDDQSRNLGPWEGYRWRLVENPDDIKNTVFLQLDVGRLVESDQFYMSMRSRKLQNGNEIYKAAFTITIPRK